MYIYDNLYPPMRSILFYSASCLPACPVCLCADAITSSEAVAQTHYNGNNTRRRVFLCFTSSARRNRVSLRAGGNLILVKKAIKYQTQHHLAPVMRRPQRTPCKKRYPESAVALAGLAARTHSHLICTIWRAVAPPGVSAVCGCANIIPY